MKSTACARVNVKQAGNKYLHVKLSRAHMKISHAQVKRFRFFHNVPLRAPQSDYFRQAIILVAIPSEQILWHMLKMLSLTKMNYSSPANSICHRGSSIFNASFNAERPVIMPVIIFLYSCIVINCRLHPICQEAKKSPHLHLHTPPNPNCSR